MDLKNTRGFAMMNGALITKNTATASTALYMPVFMPFSLAK